MFGDIKIDRLISNYNAASAKNVHIKGFFHPGPENSTKNNHRVTQVMKFGVGLF